MPSRSESRSRSQSRPAIFTTEFPHPTNLTPENTTSSTRSVTISTRNSTTPNPQSSHSASRNPDPPLPVPSNAGYQSQGQSSRSATGNTNAPRHIPSNAGNNPQGQPPRYSILSNLGNSILPNPTQRPSTTTQGNTRFNVSIGTRTSGCSRAPQIPQNFLAPIVAPSHRGSSRSLNATLPHRGSNNSTRSTPSTPSTQLTPLQARNTQYREEELDEYAMGIVRETQGDIQEFLLARGRFPHSVIWRIPEMVLGQFNPNPPVYQIPTNFYMGPGFNEEYVQEFEEDMRGQGYDEGIIEINGLALRGLYRT